MKENKLHTIKKTGFSLPDNYFDGLEDKILSQSKIDDIKEPGFKTPNNYFESLEDSILSKVVSEKETTKVISIFTKRNLMYVSSIAAAILLLFNLSVFENKPNFDSLDSETVENYIINEDITSLEIASLLTSQELIEDNFINYNLSEEHVENYILDNVDIEDIMLE